MKKWESFFEILSEAFLVLLYMAQDFFASGLSKFQPRNSFGRKFHQNTGASSGGCGKPGQRSPIAIILDSGPGTHLNGKAF